MSDCLSHLQETSGELRPMSPLRHLRTAWSQLRRRSGGLLLLCAAALLLLLLDHRPQQLQQPAAAQQSAVPHSWRVRQPAAVRRNSSREAAAAAAAAAAAGAGQVGTGEDLSEESGTATLRRSYVSGTRFVDFDPTETETNGKAKPPRPPSPPALLKHKKTSSMAGSLPLSNHVLRIPDDPALRKRPMKSDSVINLRPHLAVVPGDGPSSKKRAVTAPDADSRDDSSTKHRLIPRSRWQDEYQVYTPLT